MWFYENPNKNVPEFLLCDYEYSLVKICASREKTIHTRKIRQSLQPDRLAYVRLTNFLKIYTPVKDIFFPYSYEIKVDVMSLKFMTSLSVKQIQFGVLTQAAQIYARQFSSLQPDLWMWDLGICDFMEALTNMFMNFLYAQ